MACVGGQAGRRAMADTAGRPTVLIIEDQRALRRLYQAVLASAGYEVLEADDGEEGWRLIEERRPELVLLDLFLPKLNGYELLERIRSDERVRETAIIVLSSAGSPQDIQRGLELGADDYTVKGVYQPKQILTKIRTALAARRVKQDTASYRLSVMEGRLDAAKLQHDIGLTKLFRCPECDEPLALELVPDPARPEGHWFAAHFVCAKCNRAF
jgi:DNA-binding response OmpR family regulator